MGPEEVSVGEGRISVGEAEGAEGWTEGASAGRVKRITSFKTASVTHT